jgi:hypothetical protein
MVSNSGSRRRRKEKETLTKSIEHGRSRESFKQEWDRNSSVEYKWFWRAAASCRRCLFRMKISTCRDRNRPGKCIQHILIFPLQAPGLFSLSLSWGGLLLVCPVQPRCAVLTRIAPGGCHGFRPSHGCWLVFTTSSSHITLPTT